MWKSILDLNILKYFILYSLSLIPALFLKIYDQTFCKQSCCCDGWDWSNQCVTGTRRSFFWKYGIVYLVPPIK